MSEPQDSAAQETFISHLVELRDRLLRAIIAIVVILVALFPWAKEIYAILANPLLSVLPKGASMIATDVTGTFLVPLKVTALAAFVIALPYVLWQAWAFVADPPDDSQLLRIPLARFYGDKIVMALMGLVIPPLLAFFFEQIGLGFPIAIPAIASLGLAVVMFFLPNYNAVDDARKARLEFARALGAYIDLVALERQQPRAPTVPCHLRPFGRDRCYRRVREVAQHLPADRRVRVQQPINHRHRSSVGDLARHAAPPSTRKPGRAWLALFALETNQGRKMIGSEENTCTVSQNVTVSSSSPLKYPASTSQVSLSAPPVTTSNPRSCASM